MHRMLLRQLNRFFGPADAVPAHLRNFINAVDEAYEQNDAEQKHLQHSYEQAAKDLAERNRQVALRTRELEALKQAAVDCIIVCDFEARIIDANPAAQAALGRTIHELRGQVIYDTIVPDAHRDAHSDLIARHLSGHETGVSRIETRCVRPATGEFPVEMAVTVVRGEGPSQVLVCFRDISTRKGGAGGAPEAAARTQQAPSIPPDMVTRIAGQLAGPMEDMTRSLDQLEDTALSGQQRHYAETLRNASDSITRLLSRMVEQVGSSAGRSESESEIESEPVDPGDQNEFDLGRVVEEMVETLAPQAGQKGLEFTYSVNPDVPTAVIGDPQRFRQVLMNLVGNAIKFTDHGEVAVQVTASEQSDSHVTVRCAVKDSGRGIPPELLEKLYKQIDNPQSSWNHGGKGLMVSRQLVAGMGGTIGMESQPGQGSTFWFTAKLRKQNRDSYRDDREDGPMIRPTDGIRVLVVDDNATNCTVMKEQLEGWGMAVQTAPGGSEALKILLDGVVANKPFDVAVIDYEMPGMDGIELGRTIRAIPTFRRIPMVLLRPSTAMVNDMMMKDGGFSVCLVKPLRPTQLKDAVENAMSAPAVAGSGGGGGYLEQSLRREEPAEEREPSPPPPPGPMKLEMVIQRCMGDLQYLERILYQFQEQSNETLDRITERLNARDAGGAANLASALRGAAEYMGADDLRDHAMHIEELASNSLLNESLKAMGALREEVFRCIDYIPELLHQAATRKEFA